jgi:hypothetical protein
VQNKSLFPQKQPLPNPPKSRETTDSSTILRHLLGICWAFVGQLLGNSQQNKKRQPTDTQLIAFDHGELNCTPKVLCPTFGVQFRTGMRDLS